MKLRPLLASLAVAAFAAFTSVSAAPLARHVVLIGVDGLSPRGILETETPHLRALAQRGAHTWHARAVMPTSSSPNWASMIMGAGPEQHGVTSNDWQPDKFDIAPVVKGPRGIFPTIYGVRREQRPDAMIGIFHDWKDYARLVERDMVDVIEHPINDGKTDMGARQTMAAAIKFLGAKKPTFLFVHLDHVDHAGHQIGWFTEEYFAAVRVADKLIGDMVAAIKQAGLENNTIILITSDHGGAGKKHGGATMGEIEIPWIIAGPAIKPGHVITAPVNTYDTAPTLAKIFGITPPTCWIARPVTSAFVQPVE